MVSDSATAPAVPLTLPGKECDMKRVFRQSWTRVIPRVAAFSLVDIVIAVSWVETPGVVRVSGVVLGVLLLVVAIHAAVEKVEVAHNRICVRDLRGVHFFNSGDSTWDISRIEFGVVRRRSVEVIALRGNDGQRADVMLMYYNEQDRTALKGMVRRCLRRAKKRQR